MGRGAISIATAAAALLALGATPAAAEPTSFAHGTIEYQYTTTKPGTASGWKFDGRYHAAGDPSKDPPYMRRMTFYPPPGLRYDFAVAERCTASDLELQTRGSSACPAASNVASGVAYGKFMGQTSELQVEVFNGDGQQVMVVSTPFMSTVSRGRFAPDGSVTYESPTCYPALPPGCPIDTALQTGSSVSGKPLTRVIDGARRSYMTTPPKCPKTGHWSGRVRFWWADGSEETVVTKQPCTRPKAKKRKRKRR
jgi:hypothetical protein